MIGNDNALYESTPDKNGVHRWQAVKHVALVTPAGIDYLSGTLSPIAVRRRVKQGWQKKRKSPQAKKRAAKRTSPKAKRR